LPGLQEQSARQLRKGVHNRVARGNPEREDTFTSALPLKEGGGIGGRRLGACGACGAVSGEASIPAAGIQARIIRATRHLNSATAPPPPPSPSKGGGA